MKQHWQMQHEWKVEDVRFELEQIWEFKKLLRMHPDDGIGDILRDLIKECKKCLAKAIKSYEDVYGDKPNVRRIREEVEKIDGEKSP